MAQALACDSLLDLHETRKSQAKACATFSSH